MCVQQIPDTTYQITLKETEGEIQDELAYEM
jgi:hypothetical protein